MKTELRNDADYSLLVPTSMGIRLTPVNGQPVYCSETFQMYATSAESNVASVSSYLGLNVKVLTTFVKGSPIARFIKDNLASRHIDFEGPEIEQGNPWGYRHQINIADSGSGSRGPRVHNDRAGEVGRTLNVKDFELDRIFGSEGVQIVHLSGLIGALSPETSTRFAWRLPGQQKSMAPVYHLISTIAHHSGKTVKMNCTIFLKKLPVCQTFWLGTKKIFSSAWGWKGRKPAARIFPLKSPDLKA